MGYRIRAVMGPDGGYRLDAGSELPPMLFDDEQAVALAVALQAATASGAAIGEAAVRALATVRQVMPARLRHRVDAVQVSAISATGAATTPAVDPEVLLTVSDAARNHEVLRFDYATDAQLADRPPRRVEPHHVVTSAGRWYLLGWDLDRDEWRVLRVDRIAPRAHRGARFSPREIPGGDAAAYVSARFKGSDRIDAWPCRGEVTLALPAREVAPFIGDGTVHEVDENHCRVISGSWSWTALAASFGRFDADIDQVSPPELAREFAVLAVRYARAAAPCVRVDSE